MSKKKKPAPPEPSDEPLVVNFNACPLCGQRGVVYHSSPVWGGKFRTQYYRCRTGSHPTWKAVLSAIVNREPPENTFR